MVRQILIQFLSSRELVLAPLLENRNIQGNRVGQRDGADFRIGGKSLRKLHGRGHACRDVVADSHHLVRAENIFRGDTVFFKEIVNQFPRIEVDDALIFQLGNMNFVCFGQRIIPAGAKAETALPQNAVVDTGIIVVSQKGDGQIQFVCFYTSDDFIRGVVKDFQLKAKLPAGDNGKLRKYHGSNSRGNADTQTPAAKMDQIPHFVCQRFQVRKDGRRLVEKKLSLAGKFYVLVGTVQKGNTQLAFQFLDGLGNSRLGDMKFSGGVCDISMFADAFEIIELVEFHRRHLLLLPSVYNKERKKSNMWDIKKFCEETKTLVNIDSGSEDLEGIAEVCRVIEGLFRQEGLFVETFDNGNRILAKTHDEEDFDVMLIGHMDTVFPKGTAAQRPYTEKDGFAHGPGVADMKSGLIMCLHLIRKLKETRPDLRICAAFNGDEEISSLKSKAWLQELSGHTKYAFVFEPGRDGKCFVRSRKGCVDIFVTFHGKASHAGVAPQDGASATIEMARWILELCAMQNLEIGTSVNAGVVRGGTAPNVVPDFAEVKFDVRVKDPAELDRIKAKAEELKNSVSVPGVTAEPVFSGECQPMNPSEVTQMLIDRLNSVAKELNLEIGWADTGGVSDANNIACLGVPTICGCGPCGGGLHSDAEFMDLSSIEKRLNLMYELIVSL